MAIDKPVSDTSRATMHEPNHDWPNVVKVELTWFIDGFFRNRTLIVEADAFFGRGLYGAPMSGDQLINTIERMRRDGPTPAPLKVGRPKNAKGSKIPTRDGRGRKSGAVGNRPGVAVRAKRKGPS